MFKTLQELVEAAGREKCRLSDLIRAREAEAAGVAENELFLKMKKQYRVMQEAARSGTERVVKSISGLTGGEGRMLWERADRALCGPLMARAAARAMAVANVNASMGKVVAAPTAGSCGILPGVLITVAEALGNSEEAVVNSLFTAAAVGEVIAVNATLAGAEGGCQAECGAAAAMAAAAAVELAGGAPEQSAHAAAFALKAVMGLVCDPVAGLVEVPCIKRNGMGAVQAVLAADMALAGLISLIPPDEVIAAMKEVGRCLPASLKETAAGGLAATPTGREIHRRVLENVHR